jgi:hypothetical protein
MTIEAGMSELPGCMIGPSEPCDAFTRLQDERDRLREKIEILEAELRVTKKLALNHASEDAAELARLRRVNAELVAALEKIADPFQGSLLYAREMARAALRSARIGR